MTTTEPTSPPPTSPGTSSRWSTAAGAAGVDALLDEADALARRARRRTAARVAELDAARPGRADARAGGDRRARRARRVVRRVCGSRSTPPIPSVGALMAARRGAGHRDQQRGPLLRARVGGGPRRAGRRAARRRPARVLPPLPARRRAATGRTCSPSRRSGSSPRRSLTGAAARGSRLFAELTSAITRRPRRRDRSSLEQGLSRLMSPDRDGAPQPRPRR